ncbi:MAG TPA: RluA family pseudouridine synthase [Candidatus Limnocylindrales bacterium]|nr:RluA family pseudouridine synthase [Candidatus Limnocylindrales bacterium]
MTDGPGDPSAALWSVLDDAEDVPDRFPSPFDEPGPHPLARRAAEMLQRELDAVGAKLDLPGGGKMFGVLVARSPDGTIVFLRAFSGTLGGHFDVPGFVPPIFDRDARLAIETPGERVVKRLTLRAAAYAASSEVARIRAEAAAVAERHRRELEALRREHATRRKMRRARRLQSEMNADARERMLEELAAESRRDKRERRDLEAAHRDERRGPEAALARTTAKLAAHARLCAMVSRSLMRQIHDTYSVVNARGELRALRSLFPDAEPPSGAGDCAAPKLLAFAYANALTPLALAEFWWGAPPPGGGRVHGNFYPACRDKCDPLLGFMLAGLDVREPHLFTRPDAAALELRVLYEDRWMVVVDKPSGLLSVPARDTGGTRSPGNSDSVEARLRARYGEPGLTLVHRLDLDTSGIVVAARDPVTYKALQEQFRSRSVKKRYIAVVDGVVHERSGRIDLAIRVDLTDRPRQIHDPVHGRSAVTEWQLLAHEPGGSRLAMFPRTGRTHQLRVHASHPLGIGHPIAGDRLYGREGERLKLHAESLELVHPATGETIRFESATPF